MAPRFKLDELPAASQQKIKEDIILGRRSMFEVAKQVGIADTSVARWMRKMPEEERLRILAKNRVEGIEADAAVVNEDRMDIANTYESLARRVEKLITKAEAANDDAFALAAMEGLRKVLRDIATMQGKLATQVNVQVTLAQSPEWITMRAILQEVCEEVPAAREPLLRRMRKRVLSLGDAGV